MSHYILDKAYKITAADGVAAHRVVVYDTAGAVALPAAANADALAGVTVHSQSLQNHNVSVRKAGIALVEAASAIAIGEPVSVADTDGKVKTPDETTGTQVFCLGYAETAAAADGDLIEVFLAPHARVTA